VSSTDVLLNVATAARLFHASDGTGFADLIIDGHRETWPRRAAIENIVDADPVAARCVRDHGRQSAMDGNRIRSFACRHQCCRQFHFWEALRLAKKPPAHSLAGCAGRRPSSAHSGLRLSSAARGGWERGTIRIMAMGAHRTHNTVSTVSSVSDHKDREGLNHPAPRLEQAL
jgi:hypothetical protein